MKLNKDKNMLQTGYIKRVIKSVLVAGLLLFTAQSTSAGGVNIGNDTTICLGKSITLTSDITGTYLWSNLSTSQSITLTPTSNTIVSITVTNSSGTFTGSINITVDKNCVWPGDADDNGIVENKDVLKIGLAYGYKGAARANADTSWSPQHADDWKKTFKNGLNYKFADCNGDGVIDSKDLAAIHLNYSATHSKTSETSDDGDPDLYLVPNKDTVNPGDTVIYHIYLGTITNPVNVYGISFIHQFSPNSVVDGSMNLIVNSSNCWLYNFGGSVMSFLQADYNAELANIAISRTDGTTISGYGQIGDLSIVTPENVGGKRSITDPIISKFMDVTAITSDETIVPLTTAPTTVYYRNAVATGIQNANNLSALVNVYPNPVQGNELHVNVKGITANKIEIIDMLGKSVYADVTPIKGDVQIQLPNLKQGLYLVQVYTNQGIITNKINIIN